jgi:hypothetical protein
LNILLTQPIYIIIQIMMKINDTYAITISDLNMNITLKELVLDCLDTSLEYLDSVLADKSREHRDESIKEDNTEEYQDWYFNIPLNVSSSAISAISGISNDTIELMLEFDKYHIFNPIDLEVEQLSEWDIEFLESIIKKYSIAIVYQLFEFGDYLHNDQLINVSAIYLAKNDLAKRTPQEIRKKFNIKNDLTKEEEDEIEEQTKWIKQYE